MQFLRNSTVTFSLGVKFDRRQYLALARNGICTEYAPERFHAIIMRVRSESTALIFQTGRVVLTGMRYPPGSRALHGMVRRVTKRIQHSIGEGVRKGQCLVATRDGAPFKIRQLRVRNLVGSRRVERITLQPLAAELRRRQQLGAAPMAVTRCVLDQTTFPALRCAFKFGGDDDDGDGFTCTSLIFASGRVIVTGVHQLAHLEQALKELIALTALYPSPNLCAK